MRYHYKILSVLMLCCMAALPFLTKDFINNILSYTVYYEDWEALAGKKFQYDYSWLENNRDILVIAHGLGFANDSLQNTYTAYEISRNTGFHFFEVDLWLDHNKVIRCHHGPHQPDVYSKGSCIFSELRKKVCDDKNFLILDIKTEFPETAKVISEQLVHQDSSCIIFQLYHPNDFFVFEEIQKKHQLRGPIFTYYLTRRNVTDVIKNVQDAGIKVITVPVTKNVVASSNFDYFIFTHPVSTCSDYNNAMKMKAQGIYTTNEFYNKKRLICE